MTKCRNIIKYIRIVTHYKYIYTYIYIYNVKQNTYRYCQRAEVLLPFSRDVVAFIVNFTICNSRKFKKGITPTLRN
jgi:hypothetical protein